MQVNIDKTKKELVSIIIPVYNTEKFVAKTIESAIKQTYENKEIIIINDGSTDASADICNKYVSRYENVFLYNQENCGLSGARNMGMKKAKGDFFVFLDSDDILFENAVEMMMNIIEEENSDMVIPTKYDLINENGDIIGSRTHFVIKDWSNSPELYAKNVMIARGRGWRAHSLLYRAEKIRKNNIFFPVGHTMEDFFFNIECMKYFSKLSYCDFSTVYYRKRENSITHTFRSDLWETFELEEKYILDFFEKYKDIKSDLYVNSAMSREIITFYTTIFAEYNEISWKEKKVVAKSKLESDLGKRMFKGKFIKPYNNSKFVEVYYMIMYFLIKRKMHFWAMNVATLANKIQGGR